jgi:hypothetical protein
VRRLLSVLVALFGTAAVALGVAVAFAPGAVSSVLPLARLTDVSPLVDSRLRSLAFAGVGVGCLLWIVWTAGPDRPERIDAGGAAGTDERAFVQLRETPPEVADSGRRVGERFDDDLASDAADAVEGDSPDRARRRLQQVAVAVVAETEGCSTDRAKARVGAGDWTDDRVAAAYVAGEEASLPLSRRLLAWLRPRRTTVSRVERSVDAIEALADDPASNRRGSD